MTELAKGVSFLSEKDKIGRFMSESKIAYPVSIFVILAFCSLLIVNGERDKTFAQETDPKAFKILKEKMINPQTGLPKTLDPDPFRGKAKAAYTIAKEIPEILAQIPCFCECEPLGHDNLLDCFIDNHGAG
jgi:hypothetical protein